MAPWTEAVPWGAKPVAEPVAGPVAWTEPAFWAEPEVSADDMGVELAMIDKYTGRQIECMDVK